MYRRNIEPNLDAALGDTPVVLIAGPRQSGKSTLAKETAARTGARYLTFDDGPVYTAARLDPEGFIRSIEGPVVLDEVQRVPEVFLPIKASVDRDRRPGRFLLTGSANVVLLPRLADSLAGRMEILPLWPLSQGELAGVRERFCEAIFEGRLPDFGPIEETRTTLIDRALRGGFPEPVGRQPARREAWFESYVSTVLQRDVQDLANIESLSSLPRLLQLLAVRSPALLNLAELSRSTGTPQTTLRRYFALLEALYLVRDIKPWSGSGGRRLVRSPRVLLTDTGLTAHLAGVEAGRLAIDPTSAGPLLEAFAVLEIWKQTGWSARRVQPLFYRTQAGAEVDLVLEDRAGRIVGVEVKASASIGPRDFRGLTSLAESAGDRFLRGVVLYTGSERAPFGENLEAVPMEAVWKTAG